MPIYRQADGVLAEDLDGKAAIVDPEGAELITLNLVGSLVWSLLDGHRDVDAVVSAEAPLATADAAAHADAIEAELADQSRLIAIVLGEQEPRYRIRRRELVKLTENVRR